MIRLVQFEHFFLVLVSTVVYGALASYADTERIPGDVSADPFRLLFVGNSIFFTNGGVNHVVAKLLHHHFPRTAFEASQVAESNFLLRQHLEKAWTPGTHQYEALGINSTEKWDFVIFQEESRQLAMGGDDASRSIEALKALTWLAQARGARVGVVQTWAWIDGRSALWPTFEAMQDKINTATAGYMEAERQQENTVFLAPVGLSYEFVHNVADLADFAHGQDRGAPFAERMLALIGNPYASILKLCKSKQSMMDNARAGTTALGPSTASSARQRERHTVEKGASPVNICLASNLPAGNNSFVDLYSDKLHPSREGTYLQGLIIASAMTGCRMLGVAYDFDLEPRWVPFLQSLSDAIIFYGTPEQYPPYFWSASGQSCLLGKGP
ncbi:g1095 [Coccomyxa elongata]